MNIKNIIYIALSLILLFSSLAILLVYYTQNFKEDFDFSKSVNYGDIRFETGNGYSYYDKETVYLQLAEVDIGSLTLENKGYFTQVYNSPQLVGCINLKEEIDKNSLLLNNNRFEVQFNSDGEVFSYPIKIKVDDKKTFKLKGVYNNGNIPFEQFSKDNIKSISIYKIPEKVNNPFKDGFDYNYPGYSTSCWEIEQELNPEAIILII